MPNLDHPASNDAQLASDALKAHLLERIDAADGWISFAEFMEAALYTPGLGYYAAGSVKFGAQGDFITAPELTPLFAQALARPVASIMAQSAPCVMEFGAGSGRLAADLLIALEQLQALPDHYDIVELSGALRARQKAHLAQLPAHLSARVRWLDALPETIVGVVVGNEVLDAMPVSLFERTSSTGVDGWVERGLCHRAGALAWDTRPAPAHLGALLQTYVPQHAVLRPGYIVELHETACAFVRTLAHKISRGAALLIDYGFPAHEYYHPQRSGGTLMSHYQHRASTDVLQHLGLADITAHVNFTALAESAHSEGADIFGYTSQANFLINCGIAALVQSEVPGDAAWLRQSNAVQRLVSEAEMGELFKVIAFGRGIAEPLKGFERGDRLGGL